MSSVDGPHKAVNWTKKSQVALYLSPNVVAAAAAKAVIVGRINEEV